MAKVRIEFNHSFVPNTFLKKTNTKKMFLVDEMDHNFHLIYFPETFLAYKLILNDGLVTYS
jgi:hypothetical protein